MKNEKEIIELHDKELEEVNGGLSREDLEKMIAVGDGVRLKETVRDRYVRKIAVDVERVAEFAEEEGVELQLS